MSRSIAVIRKIKAGGGKGGKVLLNLCTFLYFRTRRMSADEEICRQVSDAAFP